MRVKRGESGSDIQTRSAAFAEERASNASSVCGVCVEETTAIDRVIDFR
jgi:hypothetical protein